MKDGGPAFPIGMVYTMGNQQMINAGPQGGMSLRDYFAAAALTGICASKWGANAEERAKVSYEFADAMLAEREKP